MKTTILHYLNTNFRTMLQSWTKNILIIAIGSVFMFSCKKNVYSPDEPFESTYGPMVFATSSSEFVYALEPKTGHKVWEYKSPVEIRSTPVVLGDNLVFLAEDGLYRLNAKTGMVININKDIWSTQSSPAGQGNVVYAGTDTGTLVAYDMSSESIKWIFDPYPNNPPSTLDYAVVSSPTIFNGQVIFATVEGKVYSVDQASGTKIWEFKPTSGLPFLSSPTVSLPYVYIGCEDGNLYALDVTNGNLVWSYSTGAAIKSSPIVYGGNVIFGSDDNFIYCLDSAARAPRWTYQTQERVISSPYAYNQVIYIGSYDFHFYALNIIDGTLKWKYKTDAIIKSSPLVQGDMVYVGSYDKRLYAFDTTGSLKWDFNMNGSIEGSPVYYDLNKGFYPSISGLSKD